MKETIYLNAKSVDRFDLDQILRNAKFLYKHLDWTSPLEWLGNPFFPLAKNENKILSGLCAVPESSNCAWIRMFFSNDQKTLYDDWENLILKIKHSLLQQSITSLVALDIHPWFTDMLIFSGFLNTSTILLLEKKINFQERLNVNPNIEIFPMEIDDLEQVAEVDNAAFPPLWQNSKETLLKAYKCNSINLIAKHQNKIIGYLISSARLENAHISRLAVSPKFQSNNIGKALLSRLLNHCQEIGIKNISVNTQSDNEVSLHIYQKYGFKLTGDKILVYKFNLK